MRPRNHSIKQTFQYIHELEAKETLSEEEITDFMQWSGRLASIGYKKPLRRFLKRFSADQINTLIQHRALEGADDIQEAFGEFLAVEIFYVQDMLCFVNHVPEGTITKETDQCIDFWVQAAEVAPLDSDAVATLQAYLRQYPIAEDDRLDTVAAPMTARSIRFWEEVLSPLDDVIEEQAQRIGEHVQIRVLNPRTADGDTVIKITGIDPDNIDRVRQKGVPALRSEEDSSVWILQFGIFGLNLNTEEDITITLVVGGHINKKVNI